MNNMKPYVCLSKELWMHLTVNINGSNKILCVPKNGITDNNDSYQIYDFVEEKEFTYGINDSLKSVKFRYVDINEKFLIQNTECIEKNNNYFKDIFEKQKHFLSAFSNTDKNLNIIKSAFSFTKIDLISRFKISDLYSAYHSDSFFLEKAKESCKIMLNEHKDRAIDKLLIERKDFEKNGDIESAEEIDIVLEIIKDSTKDINFDTAKSIEELYGIWPPILLPTPF